MQSKQAHNSRKYNYRERDVKKCKSGEPTSLSDEDTGSFFGYVGYSILMAFLLHITGRIAFEPAFPKHITMYSTLLRSLRCCRYSFSTRRFPCRRKNCILAHFLKRNKGL